MHLGAVKAASKQDLVTCAVAAAANARGLLEDAELLSLAGRWPRACSLAVLAVEEAGKAGGMMALAYLPEKLMGQAPVGRILEWHEWKLAGGLLLALIPPGVPAAPKLASMPAGELAQIRSSTEELAQDEGRLKMRGLYVDINRHGSITKPSEVTESEVSAQLARARQAVSSVNALLDPSAPGRLFSPPAEAVELAQAIVDALAQAGQAHTPEAATGIMFNAVSRLREQPAADDSEHAPTHGERRRRQHHQPD